MPARRQRVKKSVSPPPRKLKRRSNAGSAEPLEDRSRDQAIAAAIDHRHRRRSSRRPARMPDDGRSPRLRRIVEIRPAPARRRHRRRWSPRRGPSARANRARRSRRRRSSGNAGRSGNVASAVSNAALMAWQLPCCGSTTQSPCSLPPMRGIRRATGTLSLARASFSTITTAKRRSVRCCASDSSVSAQMLRPAESGNADHGRDRAVERRRDHGKGAACVCERLCRDLVHANFRVKPSMTSNSGFGLRSASSGSGRFGSPSGRLNQVGTHV